MHAVIGERTHSLNGNWPFAVCFRTWWVRSPVARAAFPSSCLLSVSVPVSPSFPCTMAVPPRPTPVPGTWLAGSVVSAAVAVACSPFSCAAELVGGALGWSEEIGGMGGGTEYTAGGIVHTLEHSTPFSGRGRRAHSPRWVCTPSPGSIQGQGL